MIPRSLEGVDRPGLAVGERAAVADLRQGVLDPSGHRVRGRHGVLGGVDRAGLVDVGGGEIEVGVAEDQIGQVAARLRAEVAHGLEVGPAELLALDPPDEGRQLGHDPHEATGHLGRDGLVLDPVVVPQLVPQVPGEDRAGASPAPHGELDPTLHGGHPLGAGQQVEAVAAGAAPGGVVGVIVPEHVGEERVEGREQEPQAMRLAHPQEVVHGLDGDRVEPADLAFEVQAVADVFEHHAEGGHAVGLEPAQVAIDRIDVLAAEQPFEFRPGQGVVLADHQERLAGLGLEVSAAGARRTQGNSAPARASSTATAPGADRPCSKRVSILVRSPRSSPVAAGRPAAGPEHVPRPGCVSTVTARRRRPPIVAARVP